MAAETTNRNECSNNPDPATHQHTGRDPEDRPLTKNPESLRERNMDKTLADSYPASDPPSSIPDPEPEDPADAFLQDELKKGDKAA